MDLQDIRDRFKREIMSRIELVDERLRPTFHDIDLRADDLFVEFRASPTPVVHDLRDRLRLRIDRLYELMTRIDMSQRAYCRATFAYAQCMFLYQLNAGTSVAAMYQMFERELLIVQALPSALR